MRLNRARVIAEIKSEGILMSMNNKIREAAKMPCEMEIVL